MKLLEERGLEPSDLLGLNAERVLADIQPIFQRSRLEKLLGRGFLLSQAVERWNSRAMWVIARGDAGYPDVVESRLRYDAPLVLYGCGHAELLGTGGLAVVGSRNALPDQLRYAEEVGALAAKFARKVVSGGARGIDQAAMRGALTAGGEVAAVLADGLERAVLNRDNRNLLLNRQLVLISPYDPAVGFNVGNAMHRNKVVYALSDAALVVNCDHQSGGTWAGAIEQLEKRHLVPIYVRTGSQVGRGLEALEAKGALPWRNPRSAEEFVRLLDSSDVAPSVSSRRPALPLFEESTAALEPRGAPEGENTVLVPVELPEDSPAAKAPADELFATVRALVRRMEGALSEAELAELLQVSKAQAKAWVGRLIDEGVVERQSKPVRYRVASTVGRQESLFDANPTKE
jgi:predicted Rossmann fold nucleotide-binding protein DprA/Smf involved in DNA uptake